MLAGWKASRLQGVKAYEGTGVREYGKAERGSTPYIRTGVQSYVVGLRMRNIQRVSEFGMRNGLSSGRLEGEGAGMRGQGS